MLLSTPTKMKLQLWAGRLFIATVVFLNLQAAVLFMFKPANYAPGFELNGEIGNAMIQAMGLLFLMWNIPYLLALYHPVQHRTSLNEALAMQTIGVVGETILWRLLPTGHPVLESSVIRFIVFDTADLLLLICAWLLTHRLKN